MRGVKFDVSLFVFFCLMPRRGYDRFEFFFFIVSQTIVNLSFVYKYDHAVVRCRSNELFQLRKGKPGHVPMSDLQRKNDAPSIVSPQGTERLLRRD